jgi:outer membrane protein TolC
VGKQIDVAQAEADLTRAQGNFLSATLDYNRALANLKRAVGYANPKS